MELLKCPCHVTMYTACAGPFAVVAGTLAPSAAGAAEAGAGAADSSTIATHLAPQIRLPELEHSVKFFPLALSLFEGHLGTPFPLASYHQASRPADFQ